MNNYYQPEQLAKPQVSQPDKAQDDRDSLKVQPAREVDTLVAVAAVGLGLGGVASLSLLLEPSLAMIAIPGLIINIITLLLHKRSRNRWQVLMLSLLGVILNAMIAAIIIIVALVCGTALGTLAHLREPALEEAGSG